MMAVPSAKPAISIAATADAMSVSCVGVMFVGVVSLRVVFGMAIGVWPVI